MIKFPGPNHYNVNYQYKKIPVSMTFRHEFFYDQVLKQSPPVSGCDYSPSMRSQFKFRYNEIGIGYGKKIVFGNCKLCY